MKVLIGLLVLTAISLAGLAWVLVYVLVRFGKDAVAHGEPVGMIAVGHRWQKRQHGK